jgi:hypothetical protein
VALNLQGARVNPADRLHRVDDLEHADLLRWATECEAAPQPAARDNQSSAPESLQDLGQIAGGNARDFRNPWSGKRIAPLLTQGHDSSKGVLSGWRDQSTHP